jgi:hypothetical protein
MARKRKGGPNVNVTEVPLRAVRLELPEELHKLLRLEAAKQDTSLALVAREAVREYLMKRTGKPGVSR